MDVLSIERELISRWRIPPWKIRGLLDTTHKLVAAHKKQNRPEAYENIVRLCREHGISSHFSNIIGFPQDTEQAIHEHLNVLQSMSPTWASFYILCPIPGTEQYDEFLEAGLITERNLDGVNDYLDLRKRAYGCELAPLPQSLKLPAMKILSAPMTRIVKNTA